MRDYNGTPIVLFARTTMGELLQSFVPQTVITLHRYAFIIHIALLTDVFLLFASLLFVSFISLSLLISAIH